MNRCFLIIVVISSFLFTGCVTPWALSKKSVLNKQSRYGLAVTTPANWYQRQIHRNTLLTHNGLSLESIMITSWKWNDTLSNGYTIPKNMLLHQIPEIILGEKCAANIALNLTIAENQIIPIDSFPVSRTTYHYTSPNSLNMAGVMYCIPFIDYITVLRFEAESSHYYEKSVEDFYTMVKSIIIKKGRYHALPGIRMVGK